MSTKETNVVENCAESVIRLCYSGSVCRTLRGYGAMVESYSDQENARVFLSKRRHELEVLNLEKRKYDQQV